MKRTHTILATITLISVILTSACTAGNASSTTSSVPETAVTTTEEIYRSIISENKELFDISDNRVAQTLAYMMVEADTKDCLYFVPSKELRKNKCCIGESGEESTSL